MFRLKGGGLLPSGAPGPGSLVETIVNPQLAYLHHRLSEDLDFFCTADRMPSEIRAF
jgi:hypothetical protein